jgi:hypothetical protein
MFDVATMPRSAADGEPITGISADEKISGDADLIVFKGVFSSGDSSYSFELKSGGTGVIIYSDFIGDAEEFDHQIDVENLQREIEEAIGEEIALQSRQNALDGSEIESVREEVTAEKLEEVFWEEINQTLEDPFFRSFYDDSEWGEEFQTERGTVDEFIEFLELCVLTEREIVAGGEDYLVVEAESEFDEAGISDCSYYSDRLSELVEIACAHFRPSGFRYDYNDGCYDRYSGYSMSSESVSVSLRESANAPAREKMLASVRLKQRLAAMEVQTEKIEELTAF